MVKSIHWWATGVENAPMSVSLELQGMGSAGTPNIATRGMMERRKHWRLKSRESSLPLQHEGQTVGERQGR